MKSFATTIGAAIGAAILIVIWRALDALATLLVLFVQGVLIGGLLSVLLVGGVLLWIRVADSRDRHRRQRDGSWRLQEFVVYDDGKQPGALVRIWRWLVGGRQPVRIVADPNTMVGYALAVGPDGVVEIRHPDLDAQMKVNALAVSVHRLQALTAGDDALINVGGGPGLRMNAAAAKLAAGYYDRPPKALTTADEAPSPVDQPLLTLEDTIQQSTGDEWIIGQNPDSRKLAIIRPAADVHMAIFGATGAGKTAATGMHIVAHAIRSGYQVVVLDPKQGMDWRQWSALTEWHATDAGTFADQLAAVMREHEQRLAACQRFGVPNVAALNSDELPPVLLLIEELGELRMSMPPADRRRVDAMLSSLANLARASRIHLLALDQFPRHWPQSLLLNTKAKICYQLDSSQAGRVGEWYAQKLPPYGRFILRGDEYESWHVAPQAQAAQRLLPPPRSFDALIPAANAANGMNAPRTPVQSSTNGANAANATNANGIHTPPPPPVNATNANGSEFEYTWRDFCYAYLDANPDAPQAALRRAMAQADPERRDQTAFKGEANKWWHQWHRERDEENEQ